MLPAISVIYDSITKKPKNQKEKQVIQFEHLRNNNKENYTANYKDNVWLQGTRHRDDEDMLLYEVTNVYVFKSTGLVMKDGSLFTKEEYDPTHVRDLVILLIGIPRSERSSYNAIMLLIVGDMSRTRQLVTQRGELIEFQGD